MSNNGFGVIVMGWNYSTALGVVRSLGRAGYLVDLFFISKNKTNIRTILSSKYINYSFVYPEWNDEPIIEELIKTYSSQKTKFVILPSDDYTSSLLDRYYDKLSPFFLMPHIGKGEQGAITRLMDKSVQTELGKKYGLKVPTYTKILLSQNDEIIVPSDVVYPCFVKPLASLQGRKTEMRRCNSPEHLLEVLKCMRERRGGNRAIIAQQYLNISEEFSISGLALDEMVILPALLKRQYVSKSERGVTLVGQLVAIDEVIDFKDKLESMIRSLHFVGLFSFDLVRCGDVIYFSEINFRTAGSLYGYVRAGANLPALLVQYLIENVKPVTDPSVKLGTTFFYDKVGWEDLLHGYCTKEDFNRYQKIAEFSFLKDDLDPKPGQVLYKSLEWKYRRNKYFPILSKIWRTLKPFLKK